MVPLFVSNKKMSKFSTDLVPGKPVCLLNKTYILGKNMQTNEAYLCSGGRQFCYSVHPFLSPKIVNGNVKFYDIDA